MASRISQMRIASLLNPVSCLDSRKRMEICQFFVNIAKFVKPIRTRSSSRYPLPHLLLGKVGKTTIDDGKIPSIPTLNIPGAPSFILFLAQHEESYPGYFSGNQSSHGIASLEVVGKCHSCKEYFICEDFRIITFIEI